jgi:hypothetical protein
MKLDYIFGGGVFRFLCGMITHQFPCHLFTQKILVHCALETKRSGFSRPSIICCKFPKINLSKIIYFFFSIVSSVVLNHFTFNTVKLNISYFNKTIF